MNPIPSIRRYLERLTTVSGEDLNRGERGLRFLVALGRFTARRLKDTNAMAMSAALSFRTIFALVPILVLAFLVLKTAGVVDENKQWLQRFFEEGGLSQIVYGPSPETAPDAAAPAAPAAPETAPPETAPAPAPRHRREVTVAGMIAWAMKSAETQLTLGRLGPIGLALLVWTALTLLVTMERSLNRIFEAPRSRSLPRTIVLYWSVITLGPIALVTASYAGERAFIAAADVPQLAWTLAVASWALSLLVATVVLAAVYVLMPNTRVPWRPALAGAAMALPLWLAARWGFSVYLHQVGTKSLYGALALLPLFLLWLNLSWTIFLFGAQLVFGLAHRSRVIAGTVGRRSVAGPWDALAAAVTLVRENAAGGKPVPPSAVGRALALPEDAAEALLERLAAQGVACRTAGGRTYVLARPAETIAVAGLLDAGVGPDSPQATGWPAEIARALDPVRRRAAAGLGDLTLAAVANT
jgi:membrane protein